jgi:hypothetical protein
MATAGTQMLSDLMNEFQTAQDEATQANLERYEQVFGMYEDLRTRALEGMEGFGAAARSDIERGAQTQRTQMQQDLVSRGLTGTTILPAMEAGISAEEQRSLTQLNESLAQQAMNLDIGLTQNLGGFIERREDIGPSTGEIAGLAEMLAGQTDLSSIEGIFDFAAGVIGDIF